jgi:hypothetical protein
MAQAIDKADWARYCERLSEVLVSNKAEIEIASLELGNQIEAEWLPFLGISYDEKDDVIDIALEGVDHIIEHPRQLRADGNCAGLLTLEIQDGAGSQHLVRLKDGLALPRQH